MGRAVGEFLTRELPHRDPIPYPLTPNPCGITTG